MTCFKMAITLGYSGKKLGLIVFLVLTFLLTTASFTVNSQMVKINSTIEGTAYSAVLSAELSKPPGKGLFPAVILMHGCSSLTGAVKRGLDNHAKYLNSHGFATLILDSFSARGITNGQVCNSQTEQNSAWYYRQFDAFHALAFLQSQPFIDSRNIFLMGQSQGAVVAMTIAAGAYASAFPANPKFQAIVAYYPWCGVAKNRLRKIISPLLVFGADKDDWTPPADCVKARAHINGAPYKVITYKDAHHSFDLPISDQIYAGHLVGGNEQATLDSRTKMVDWFIEHHQNN